MAKTLSKVKRGSSLVCPSDADGRFHALLGEIRL
jgi:hypothetical protein